MMMNAYLTDDESLRFENGTWTETWKKLGAHPASRDGHCGYEFAVWAPRAKSVHLAGSFNKWKKDTFAMLRSENGGVWHLFVPGLSEGELYKYIIETENGDIIYKADPYAFFAERVPGTASRTYDPDGYEWHDELWLSQRRENGHMNRPLNIYEVHPGSWKRRDDGGWYSYKELRDELIPYAVKMGYTHLELLPVMEHPYDGSWGYQITGYFAPSSRFGEPKEFMAFIDECHQAGLGVILDWVPGHFCRDEHGLGRFDGEKLYEKEEHAQWGTYKFDLGRGQVRSFLVSNALFWLEKYHADGIRVDGVTSMLYLNFGVDDPKLKKFNEKGTEEDLCAIDFIRQINTTVSERFPDVMMIAEESTAWPLVTYPPYDGGLGFHYKWDMGWMNDTLHYMQTDFPYRPGNHNLLTFSMMYAFNENFILPLSHDEVVHGKCSLIGRMPGDYWRQFAGMRLLAMYQICHPGGKLSFMGNEIAQFIEWRYYESVEWFLTGFEAHDKYRGFIEKLNGVYRREKALWENGDSWDGFTWLDANNSGQSILSFVRHGKNSDDDLTVLLNFRTDAYTDYRVGVELAGEYEEILNSDAAEFFGSGKVNTGPLKSEEIPWHGKKRSVAVDLPPVGGVILKKRTAQKIRKAEG